MKQPLLKLVAVWVCLTGAALAQPQYFLNPYFD